jgi:hypothetical protein
MATLAAFAGTTIAAMSAWSFSLAQQFRQLRHS